MMRDFTFQISAIGLELGSTISGFTENWAMATRVSDSGTEVQILKTDSQRQRKEPQKCGSFHHINHQVPDE